jgi:ATP-dependent helicase/nuclease subunit B
MGEVDIFIGPPSSGKTERMIREISKLNPFDYTFIGSQGEFVKFAAYMATEIAGSINRSSFKTVDQFAVETVKRQTDLIFADRPLKLTILTSVIEDMASRNLDLPEEIKNEAAVVRHRSTVEKLLSLIDDVKTYMKEDEFAEAETRRDMFISGVIKRFGDKMKSMKLFDTYDAYRMIADGEIKTEGKYLFIDGFYDFTPVVAKFFKAVISGFEKTFITVTDGDIFERGTSTILKTVEIFSCKKTEMKFSGTSVAHGLFFGKGEGVKIHAFEKLNDEIEWVSKKVKTLLMNGKKVQDFEIVVKSENNDYIKAIEDKLGEYDIDVSYLGKKSLNQSTSVQKVMLPLRVVTGGYPQDLLMSMIMAGFSDNTAFSFVYDRSHLNRGPLRLSYKSRMDDWNRRLDNFAKYLSKMKLLISEDDEFQDRSLDDLQRMQELVEDAKKTVKNLFDFLIKFENAIFVDDYSKAFEEAIQIIGANVPDEEKEALDQFTDLIWEIESVLNFAGIKEINSSDYRYYLELQIKDRTYVPSRGKNGVRISDVITSRFSHAPLKIFVGFTDGNYPEFHPNYFYNSIEEEKHFGTNRNLKRLLDDRLDLYTAMAQAKEVYLTMPQATQEGVKILPSMYLVDLEEKFGMPEKPETYPSMSLQEATISYAKWARWNGRNTEIENKLDVMIQKSKTMLVKDLANLEYCRTLSKAPVSFYRYFSYQTCPLKYFFSYAMKLPQAIIYDLDLNSLELGTVYHNSLKRLVKAGRKYLRDLTSEELKLIVQQILNEELGKMSFFEPEIFEINLLKFTSVIMNYLEKVEFPEEIDGRNRNLKAYKIYKTDHGFDFFNPREFEFTFTGMEEAKIDDMDFSGRIDRIDECESGLMIIDYKSKNTGEKAQLALYSNICEKIFKMPVIQSAFIVVEDAKIVNMMDRDKIHEVWNELIESMKDFIKGVANGDFTPQSCKDNCERCDFNKICPVRWPDGTFKCSK